MTFIKAGTAKTVSKPDDPLGSYSEELISDTGGLSQFGAFVETLEPGASSSLMHWHRSEDEMVYLLSGTATLCEDGREFTMEPGDAACFKASDPVGHCLKNTSDAPVRYLVIGTRRQDDVVTYPRLDRRLIRTAEGRRWTDLAGAPAGNPYEEQS